MKFKAFYPSTTKVSYIKVTHSFNSVALLHISEMPPVLGACLAYFKTAKTNIPDSLSIWGIFVGFSWDHCTLSVDTGDNVGKPVELSDVRELVTLLYDVVIVFGVEIIPLVLLG